MKMQSSKEINLRAGWKALAGFDRAEGWAMLPFEGETSEVFRIGVHYPERAESVLVRIPGDAIIADKDLPKGKGFEVVSFPDEDGNPFHWLALMRRSKGSLDLFATMALDIVALLHSSSCSEREFLPLFLFRVKAWQKFMEGENPGKISASVVTGLMGELKLLDSLLDAGVPPRDAVSAWMGPLGGLHDFAFNTLHFEVKSTVSEGGFPVQIGSADQLDTGVCSPLFLYACRFSKENGIVPAARVRELEERLSIDDRAVEEFRSRLLSLGIADMECLEDAGRFRLVDTAIYRITDDFPALMASRLPAEIGKVHYQIDLTMLKMSREELPDILQSMGEYENGAC